MEEERRLFYVALTRARDRLHLYCTEKRGEHRPALSRVFSEMGIKVEEGPEEKENSRLLPEEKDGCFA